MRRIGASLWRHKLVRNGLWLFASYTVAKPIWLLFITVGCMRMLEPEQYGVFTVSLALALLMASISDVGTIELTVRDVARQPAIASRLLSHLLAGRAVLAGLVFLLMLGVGVALGYSVDHMYALAGAGLYAFTYRATEMLRGLFRALERLKDEALGTILEKGIVVAAGMVALAATRDPTFTLFAMAGGMVSVFGLHAWWVHTRFAPLRTGRLRYSFLRRKLWQSIPLGLVMVFSAAPLSMAPVLVELWLGTEMAGYYGAAQRIVEAMMLLPTLIVLVVFARLSQYYKQDSEAYFRLLKQAALITGGITLVVAVAVGVGAGSLISLLAGGSYEPSMSVLAGFVWIYPLMAMAYLSTTALIAADGHRASILITGVAAMAAPLLIGMLIERLGLLAPVVALGVAQLMIVMANLMANLVLRRRERVTVVKTG